VDDANNTRRMRLAQALLGLKPGEPVSTEQQKMSLATAAVILSDMIGHIQRAAKARGSGMAVVRPDGNLAWFSDDDVIEQLDLAVRTGDSDLAATFRDLVALLERLDPDDHIILGMATGSALRVFKIPIDDPGGFLRKLLAEWGR
jgi:hypothetical protein